MTERTVAMFSLAQDLRFALRQLRKSPAYTFVAILTLALGIGANTAIFLLTYTIVLRSLPVPHPGELVRFTAWTNGDHDLPMSYPLYAAVRAHQTATSDVFAWAERESELKEGDSAFKVHAGLTTGSFFPVLELQPFRGRALDSSAGEPNAAFKPEALLSYDFWRTHYGADPAVIGRNITVDKVSLTVVGVLPRGFEGIRPERPIDLLVPLSIETVLRPKFSMMKEPGAFWLTVMGRMRPGQTLASTQAAGDATLKSIIEEADPTHRFYAGVFGGGLRILAVPGRNGSSYLRTQYQEPLFALEALCGLMMLLCAVNTALLVLSRVSGRLHEFAVRSALGAARSRLIAQVLAETGMLAAGGLLLGGLIGWELAHALIALITSPGDPAVLQLQPVLAIGLFAVTLSLAAALLAGLWPAWRVSRSAPALDLRFLHTQRGSSRLGRWIVPTQVALGVVLIYAALLLTGTLRNYLREHSGFVTEQVTFADVNYQNDDFSDSDQARKGFELVKALDQTPGIQAAALLGMPPLQGWNASSDEFTRDSHGNLHHDADVWAESVTPHYFAALGTAIVRGRAFGSSDIGGDRVCLISRGGADFFFPGEDPIGASISDGDGQPAKQPQSGESGSPSSCRIIGVAEDARMKSLLSPAPIVLYSLAQQARHPFVISVLAVRSANPQLAADAIRREAAHILPGAAPPKTYSFDSVLNDDLSRQRLLSSVSGGFALLALALVATGLYGILARAVVEQRREIGIRMALGAQRGQIVSHLARGAVARVLIGVAAGAGLALVAGRLLRTLLYGITG
ncbi:MAG: ABC transporter permease, partial [Acidobacteriaceae bacterium]